MRDRKTDGRIREMVLKEHWEMPGTLDRRIEELLNGLEEADSGNIRKAGSTKPAAACRSKRLPGRRIVLAAAALAAVLGITAAASELFDWHLQAVKNFQEPTKEEQDQMTMEGLAVGQEVSDSDQGITVTAEQIVQDEICLYILLNIQAEENIIDGNGSFANEMEDESLCVLKTSDPDTFNNVSWGFAPDTPSFGELSDHGYYEIFAMKTPDHEWNEDSITVQFKEYTYYTYENGDTVPHTIKGDWTLTLPLGSQDFAKACIFEPESSTLIKGVSIQVKRVELSPLSMVMVFDMDDYEKLKETLYPDAEDVILTELQLSGFLTKDGGEIPCGIGGISGEYDYESREVIQRITISRFVNPDQVSAVFLGEEKVPVELK